MTLDNLMDRLRNTALSSKRLRPRPRWFNASTAALALATRARRAASAALAWRSARTTKRRSVQHCQTPSTSKRMGTWRS